MNRTEPPRDCAPGHDQEYIDQVAIPLAQGFGVACFYATIDDETAGVAARYNAGQAEAVDPDWRTRARELIRAQMSAREIAATMGLEAVVR